MMCPKCDSLNLRAVDVRPRNVGNVNYRRRECLDCGHRFSTFELPEGEINAIAGKIFAARLKKKLSARMAEIIGETFAELADFREENDK